MIREAELGDLPELLHIGARFHAWAGMPVAFDPGSFAESCTAVIGRDDAALFMGEGGMLGLSCVPLYFNRAAKIALEVFFWAPGGNGDEYRKAAEAWAKDRAALLVMCAHEPFERTEIWYRRKGYAPHGRSFMKVV